MLMALEVKKTENEARAAVFSGPPSIAVTTAMPVPGRSVLAGQAQSRGNRRQDLGEQLKFCTYARHWTRRDT
jgi:hypothetical protein